MSPRAGFLRAALENYLNTIWYREVPPPWFLRMLTPVYRGLYAIDRKRGLRHAATDLESECIVVVGNLTVGGSGKTPLLIRLCELFRQAGLSPAVISRGYGRQDNKQRLVVPASNPGLVGDEPLLIARRSGVPVMVGPDRSEAAREMFARGANVVISDDGLQHHALPRAIEICVVDGQRGFGNGFLLPAGPLREDTGRLRTVDHVVINGGGLRRVPGGDALNGVDWSPMDVHARKVHALGEKLSWRLSQFTGCKVNAVAGVANPVRFFDLLRQAGIEVVEKTFPDHHFYRPEDFSGLPEGLPVIMTEKDAVKCKGLALKNAWYLAVDAQLPPDWERNLVRQVAEFINER